MNRKTTGALLVFIVLLGLVYYLQTRPEKGERTGERPRPIPALAEKGIRSVTIAAKGATVVLDHDKGGWRLSRPVEDDADPQAVKTMVDKLTTLEFGDLVTQRRDRHAQHGLDDKSAIHVVVSDGKAKVADFVLGKVQDNFTMLRATGSDSVYQVVGALRYVFEREPKNWRDRTILRFEQKKARMLQVTTRDIPGAGAITLSRPDPETDWKVTRSDAKITRLDGSVVRSLLSATSNVTAFDFADGAATLRAPVATIVVQLEGGKNETLLVGRLEGDAHRVQHAGDPQVFIVKKYAVTNLLRRPVDFRDKSVLAFEAGEVTHLVINKKKDGTSVTLTRRGEDWLGDGKKVADTTKLKGALATLSNLRAEGIAWHSAQELGLDRPDWELEVRMKDGSRHRVTVGSAERDGKLGLAVEGTPDIFTLRRHTLDRFLLDPRDYR